MKKDKNIDRLINEELMYDDNEKFESSGVLFLKEKAKNKMLHDENSDDSLDLIEWEDDGNGNYIQK